MTMVARSSRTRVAVAVIVVVCAAISNHAQADEGGGGEDPYTSLTPRRMTVNSTITKVVVFPDCAEVTRTIRLDSGDDTDLIDSSGTGAAGTGSGAMTTSEGAVDLVLEGLPLSLNASSLRVSADGRVSIIGVTSDVRARQSNRPGETPADPDEVVALKDRLRELERQFAEVSAPVSAAEKQLKLVDIALDTAVKDRHTMEALLGAPRHKQDKAAGVTKTTTDSDTDEDATDARQSGFALLEFLAETSDRRLQLSTQLIELRAQKEAVHDAVKQARKDRDKAVEAENARRRKAQDAERRVGVTSHGVDVTVSVDIKSIAGATLSVTYLVGESTAGWTPAYDLRVNSTTAAMQLVYMGNVRQGTGEDWQAAEMWLSMASPSLRAVPPKLGTRHVSFKSKWAHEAEDSSSSYVQNMARPSARMMKSRGNLNQGNQQQNAWQETAVSAGSMHTSADTVHVQSGAGSSTGGAVHLMSDQASGGVGGDVLPTAGAFFDDGDEEGESGGGGGGVARGDSGWARAEGVDNGGGASSSFKIHRLTTVPSNDSPHKVTLELLDLQSTFTHVAAPSADKYAYILASAVNTGHMPLLSSSQVQVFVDGTFVASSRMKYVAPNEAFATFLGQDKEVKITHVAPRSTHATAGLFSESHYQTYRHSTRVRNNKRVPIRLVMDQQLPMSDDDRIHVNLLVPKPYDLLKAPPAVAAGDHDAVDGFGVGAPARDNDKPATAAPAAAGGRTDGGIKPPSSTASGANAGAGAGGDAARGCQADGSCPSTDTGAATSDTSPPEPAFTEGIWIDADTNNVRWARRVMPGATLEVPFDYEIVWPTDTGHPGVVLD